MADELPPLDTDILRDVKKLGRGPRELRTMKRELTDNEVFERRFAERIRRCRKGLQPSTKQYIDHIGKGRPSKSTGTSGALVSGGMHPAQEPGLLVHGPPRIRLNGKQPCLNRGPQEHLAGSTSVGCSGRERPFLLAGDGWPRLDADVVRDVQKLDRLQKERCGRNNINSQTEEVDTAAGKVDACCLSGSARASP